MNDVFRTFSMRPNNVIINFEDCQLFLLCVGVDLNWDLILFLKLHAYHVKQSLAYHKWTISVKLSKVTCLLKWWWLFEAYLQGKSLWLICLFTSGDSVDDNFTLLSKKDVPFFNRGLGIACKYSPKKLSHWSGVKWKVAGALLTLIKGWKERYWTEKLAD